MESKMFPGYLSHRSIELNRASESTTINDRISPLQKESDKSHYITRFLVPSDKSVTWEKDKIVVHGYNHRMMIRSNKSLNRIFIESGQNFPQTRGWCSSQFNTLSPAISIGVSHFASTLDIDFHLAFEVIGKN